MGALCPPGAHSAPATTTSPGVTGAAWCSSAAPKKRSPLAGPRTSPPPRQLPGHCSVLQQGQARRPVLPSHFPRALPGKVLRAKGSWLCRSQQSSHFAWQDSSFLEEDSESHSSRGRAWCPSCLFKPSCKHQLCLLTLKSTLLCGTQRQARESPSCKVPPGLTAHTARGERGVSGLASYPRS